MNRKIESCRRCGGTHEAVELHAFTRPMPDIDGDFTHWATCPTSGDPILIRGDGAPRLMRTGRIAIWASQVDGDKWVNLTGAELAALLRQPHKAVATYAGGDKQPHDWEMAFIDDPGEEVGSLDP